MKLLTVEFYPICSSFLPFNSKHRPQNTILQHPQPLIFPYHVITLLGKKYEYFNVKFAGKYSNHVLLKG